MYDAPNYLKSTPSDTLEGFLEVNKGAIISFFETNNPKLASFGPAVNVLTVEKSGKEFRLRVLCMHTICHAYNSKNDSLKDTVYYIQSLEFNRNSITREDAENFWSYYFDRDDRIFKHIVGKDCCNITYFYDKTKKKCAIGIKVHPDTDFLQLHTAVVLTRTPLERAGCLELYKRILEKAGMDEDKARYLTQVFMSREGAAYTTPVMHFPFRGWSTPFSTFINGVPNSGRRIGGGYGGCYFHYSRKGADYRDFDLLYKRRTKTRGLKTTFDAGWIISEDAPTFELCLSDPIAVFNILEEFHNGGK